MSAAGPGLLEARGISKRFGGVQALQDVGFAIGQGEIFGLIGPNGAGKTTLFNLLTGIYAPDAGTFVFDGRALGGRRPDQIAAAGIARTFQNIRLFANLSALENVMIGRHVRTRAGVFGAILRSKANPRRGRAHRAARAGAARLRGHPPPRQRCAPGSLPYGDQRRLEIARALATEPKLLALDEPAAGMNPTERLALGKLIRAIRDGGVTVLLIEHDVRLVMGMCDRVMVLDYGREDRRGPACRGAEGPARHRSLLGSAAWGGLGERRMLLEVKGLEVHYGGIRAVKGIDLARRARASW